jgi:hypothetical protein
MALRSLGILRFRLSCLSILFILIACLASFTPGLQAQSAHFSGAVGNAGSVTDAAVGAANDVQATNGNFGRVNVGASSVTPVAIVFTFDESVTLGSTAVLTQGAANLDFTDAGGGTCTADKIYNAGDTCTVKVTFKPRAPGARYGGVELLDTAGNLLANAYVQGTGVGPQVTFANSSSGDYLPSHQINLASGSGIYPGCVTVDASGNLFIPQGNDVSEILAVNGSIPASPTIRTLATGFILPRCVAVDGSGNLFIADNLDRKVKEIVAAGGYTTVKTLASEWRDPIDVAVDGSGNLFIASMDYGAPVKEILAAGGYTTVKILGGGSISGYAVGVALDGSGNVFVTSIMGYSAPLYEILAEGRYTTVKTLASGLYCPDSVAVDASGNLFVTDFCARTFNEVLAEGGYTTIHTLSRDPNFEVLGMDGSGNVFKSDWPHDGVVKLDYAEPPSLTFGKTTVGVESGDSPQTVTVSNNGNADLTFPVPASGHNPSISSSFTLDVLTTCPQLSASSTAGTLAAGASCDYAVDFTPVAGTDSGSLTLTDNNLNASPAVTQTIPLAGTLIGPHLAFTTPPPASLEVGHSPGTVVVSVEDSSGKVVTTSSATVTLIVTGPNSYSKVYTAMASGGTATFGSLASLSNAGSYSYTATDTPDVLVQAVATESVGAPYLAFTTPPPLKLAVGNGQETVAVSLEDFSGNVITTSSATVTLTVTGPNSYSKVYTATALNGIATFDSLESLKTIGGYSYSATDAPDGLSPTVATEFLFAFAPLGWIDRAVDSITFSTTVAQSGSLMVTGWTADVQDGAPVADVKAYIDGNLIGTLQLGIPRPDVVAAAPSNKTYLLSGFRLLYQASSLSLGTHQVMVVATDSFGQSTTFGPWNFTVAAAAGTGRPIGGIDPAVDSVTGSTTVGQSDSLKVRGWVADPQDGAPLSNVTVYIDGTSIGAPTLGIARPDVVAFFNRSAYLNSGYQLLYPVSSLSLGTHQVTVVAIDSGGLSTTFGPRTITVATTAGAGNPVGNLDLAVDSGTGSTTVSQSDSIKVRGWVADPNDGAPLSNVTVYIDGTSIGTPTLGIARRDVAAVLNNSAYLNSGYQLLYPASSLSPGLHGVTVVAVDSGGRSTNFGPRVITVQ